MNRIAAKRLLRGLCVVVGFALWAGTAAAGPFSGLVVFGDSLSDIGNVQQSFLTNTPGPYYSNGRFSNGPVYAESLATGLGLPALTRSTAGGGDFAYGGAKSSGTSFPTSLVVQDVDDQVGQYLARKTTNASTLYVVFAGANDLIDGQTNMSVPVNSLSTSINRLVTAGARQFLVLNLPPLGETPRYNGSPTTRSTYDMRAQQYNTTLATMLGTLHSNNPAVTVYQFDVFGLFNSVLANPAAFGLINATNSAAPGLEPGDTSYDTSQIVANPNQYLFWDDLHPTTTVHAILGQRALDLFRLPGDFNGDNVVDSADYILWRKGQSPSHIPDDYNVWENHYGQTASLGGGTSIGGVESMSTSLGVPEPSAIVLSLWGVAVCIASIQRRRS